MDLLETYAERGFIAQVTDEEALGRLLQTEQVTAYIGFDPTADSLHVGSLLPIMALAHLQRAGHRPVAIVGGGTGMVGDPSGKTEMRQLLTLEKIEQNALGLKEQLGRYLDFGPDKALMINNADWLCEFKYVDFLRDIGRHFTINRMLTYESVKQRLESETGLSFIEFNYMLLQAYDFYHLAMHHGCRLQMGGNDQWGNITAGIDLSRRLGGPQLYGLTFPLLTTSSGAKMGKTAEGAIWLDPKRTSPYDFFQYWRNTEDDDVESFLAYFTFLPLDEVRELGGLEGSDINRAKEVLAYEVTKLAHGKKAADQARSAARAAFAGAGDLGDMPTVMLTRDEFETMVAFQLFARTGLCSSSSDARRLIKQGGAYIDDISVDSFDQKVKESVNPNGSLVRAGKKRIKRVIVVD